MAESASIPVFDTHVCIVSQQAAANLLPAIEPALRPKHLILAVTPEMKSEAEWLQLALKESLPGIAVEKFEISSAYDLSGMIDSFLKLFVRLKDEGRTPLVNVTGGTKPMAIAALRCAECAELPSFYLELDRNVVTFLTGRHETVRLSSIPNLKAYLLAYGLRLQKAPPAKLPFTSALKALTERLLKTESFRSCYPEINYLAAQAAQSSALTAECAELTPAASALLDEFEQCGLLQVQGKRIRFASEEARFFVNGGWLEDLTAAIVQAEFPDSKVIPNAQVENLATQQSSSTDKTVRNELDTLFWANGNLCIIECKTSSLAPEGKSDGVIYKLSSIDRQLGKRLTPILISYLPLSDFARSRAKSAGIRVIAGGDLKRLAERIKHFAGGH